MPCTRNQAKWTKASILSTALWARREVSASAWLAQLLKDMGQDPANGIVVGFTRCRIKAVSFTVALG